MDGFRNFGFLLKDLTQLYVRRFEQHATHLGMTLPQCKVLAKLAQNEGISQARLAELAEVDPMTLVRILDRMEADGWVERRPDPNDRRARRLHMKSKAVPLVEAIWRLADTTRAETFAGVSKDEREVFIGLLGRLHANLSAAAGAPKQNLAAVPDTAAGRPARKQGKQDGAQPGDQKTKGKAATPSRGNAAGKRGTTSSARAA